MWFMIISIKLSQSFFGQKFSFTTAKNKEKSNKKRGSKTISKSFLSLSDGKRNKNNTLQNRFSDFTKTIIYKSNSYIRYKHND